MLKPQDILVTLKFLTRMEERGQTYAALAGQLGMSVAETHASIRRAAASRLLIPSSVGAKRLPEMRVSPFPLRDVLCHGVPYFLPAQAGPLVTGIPTAGDARPLVSLLSANPALPMVWKHRSGQVRGLCVEPIYPSATEAALGDPELAEWLALVDAVRLGPGRLAELARSQIEKKLYPYRYAAAA